MLRDEIVGKDSAITGGDDRADTKPTPNQSTGTKAVANQANEIQRRGRESLGRASLISKISEV